jgi:hypothetical protein
VKFVALLLCLSFFAHAQDEQPENNLDLRGGKPLMLLENSGERLELERTIGGDFYVSRARGEDLTKHKLVRQRAEELSQQFSALFLQVQYELPNDPEKCTQDWRLVLHGETYVFCSKNEQKHQVVKKFFDEIRSASTP